MYVFAYDGSSWNEQARLLASDAANGDHFGESVSIDGDTLIVGAKYEDSAGTDSGCAYVFEYDGQQWVEQAKLLSQGDESGFVAKFGQNG